MFDRVEIHIYTKQFSKIKTNKNRKLERRTYPKTTHVSIKCPFYRNLLHLITKLTGNYTETYWQLYRNLMAIIP